VGLCAVAHDVCELLELLAGDFDLADFEEAREELVKFASVSVGVCHCGSSEAGKSSAPWPRSRGSIQ